LRLHDVIDAQAYLARVRELLPEIFRTLPSAEAGRDFNRTCRLSGTLTCLPKRRCRADGIGEVSREQESKSW